MGCGTSTSAVHDDTTLSSIRSTVDSEPPRMEARARHVTALSPRAPPVPCADAARRMREERGRHIELATERVIRAAVEKRHPSTRTQVDGNSAEVRAARPRGNPFHLHRHQHRGAKNQHHSSGVGTQHHSRGAFALNHQALPPDILIAPAVNPLLPPRRVAQETDVANSISCASQLAARSSTPGADDPFGAHVYSHSSNPMLDSAASALR